MDSYSFHHENALAILTAAAMQSNQTNTSDTSTSNSSYEPSSRVISNLYSDDVDVPRNTPDRTHLMSASGHKPLISATSSMETMSYCQPNGATLGRLNPYLNAGYRGIGTQISTNYAANLGILNAESYDDRRHAMTTQETADMRSKQQVELPFGITGHPTIRLDDERKTESDELERGTKRRRKHKLADTQDADEEEEARKKARGRPRVDTKDETAADRRRTQIRMAQRAYRNRKETTITSLEKQVQDLRGTNEEMSNIFISLYDFAVGRGLLQREPEFGQQLQSTTERFLALAKATSNEEGSVDESHAEETAKNSEPKAAPRKKNSRGSLEKRQVEIPQESPPVQTWGGYTVTKDDSPVEEISLNYQHQGFENRARHGDLQVITRPTEDNASFPFDFVDIQQYRVEIPPVDSFSQNFLPFSQPPMPNTLAYNEFSFARRIHRGALEKAVTLLSLENPPKQRFQEVFGLSLMYLTKEELLSKFKSLLAGSSKETLQDWRKPFVHTGGSGTFYPLHDSDLNGEFMPKFRTGFSMGPFSPRVSVVQDSFQSDMRCSLPGYQGDFFDPNDVEGYLRGRGLDIPPAADFVTAEIDLSEITSPKSMTSSDSVLSSLSPQTPQSPAERGITESNSYAYNFDFTEPEGKAFPFPIGYADWEDNGAAREASNIDPVFNVAPIRSFSRTVERATVEPRASEPPFGERRLVTINVKVLLEELLSRGVCLGRAPGFRPADVNASIIAAIKARF